MEEEINHEWCQIINYFKIFKRSVINLKCKLDNYRQKQ